MPSAQHWLNCSQKSQDKSQGAESDLSKTIANPNRQKNRPLLFLFHYFKDRASRVQKESFSDLKVQSVASQCFHVLPRRCRFSSFSSKIAYTSSFLHLTSNIFCDSSNRIELATLVFTYHRCHPCQAVPYLCRDGRYGSRP